MTGIGRSDFFRRMEDEIANIEYRNLRAEAVCPMPGVVVLNEKLSGMGENVPGEGFNILNVGRDAHRQGKVGSR